jgi:hypothetical protein
MAPSGTSAVSCARAANDVNDSKKALRKRLALKKGIIRISNELPCKLMGSKMGNKRMVFYSLKMYRKAILAP